VGEMVEFASNGKSAQGYLARPNGTGPGVVVIQEWWGLNDHVKDVADRFAAQGFVALAPDLYHGEVTKEPDEAGKLLMAMDIDRAAKDMSGAVAYLRASSAVEPKKVGTVGFCMGGNLALLLATVAQVEAAVAFYPYPRTQPDFSKTTSNVLLHIAEEDQAPSPEMAREIAKQVEASGHSVEVHTYPSADHAFFNDTRADAYKPDAAKLAWERTIAFFNSNLR
jgi:carboxymethylenebutenolidase